MIWNSEDHPRDEEGKFTFKEGGSKSEEENIVKINQKDDTYQNQKPFKLGAKIDVYKNEALKESAEEKIKNPIEKAAEILYKNTKKQETEKEKNRKLKKVLLDKLGESATPAMILYYKPKDLERVIKEKGLKIKDKIITDELREKIKKEGTGKVIEDGLKRAINKLEEKVKEKGAQVKDKIITSEALQKVTEKMIGKDYKWGKYNITGVGGADTQGMLDIAHGEDKMHNPNYLKDAIKLENYNDSRIKKHYNAVRKKVTEQFKDYGYDENSAQNIKGYYFKNDSEPSRRIAQSKDFHNILIKNKENILTNKNFSISFPKHGPFGILWNNNFKNALGKADILEYHFDKEGNLNLKIFDTYDFNKNARDFLNKAGSSQMDKGNLKPFFTIHNVIIPKEEADRILYGES